MRGLTQRGLLVLGGPFADEDATGPVGVAIITVGDAAEDERVARVDRSVASGLIRVTVRPWTVPMGFALDAVPPPDAG